MATFFQQSRDRSRLRKLNKNHMRSASMQDIINGDYIPHPLPKRSQDPIKELLLAKSKSIQKLAAVNSNFTTNESPTKDFPMIKAGMKK